MDFDAFYRDTSRRLLRYAYGLTGDAGEAQDLVQEAYARAWQRRRRLAGYEDPEAWLRLVVNRLAADRWRRLRVRRDRAAADGPGRPAGYNDETFVLVTSEGSELRKVRTGELVRTGPAVGADAADLVADRGWLYDREGDRVRATDLAGNGGTHTYPLPGRFDGLAGCGTGRMCVTTEGPHNTTVLTVFDLAGRRTRWQRTAPAGLTGLSSANGWILGQDPVGLMLWDPDGREFYRAELFGGWLGAQRRLLLDEATGKVQRHSLTDGGTTTLGTIPAGGRGTCRSTPDRWICPTPAGLTIWDVG